MAFRAIGPSLVILVLTAELGCDAHAVTASCHLLCGTHTIHDVNLLSIDCTGVSAKRPGLTNMAATVQQSHSKLVWATSPMRVVGIAYACACDVCVL